MFIINDRDAYAGYSVKIYQVLTWRDANKIKWGIKNVNLVLSIVNYLRK